MLTLLKIRNLALVDELAWELGSGLISVTGETGAGKSILLDSLGLALGARTDASLIRKGTSTASVTAIFSVSPTHPAQKLILEQELETQDDIIIRRTLSADGKSKC
ncbi:MAG: AAA family ATPase, partial [bacterium]